MHELSLDIDITFGMHNGHSLTYQVVMTDGNINLGRIFDMYAFKTKMQDFIKEGLRKYRKLHIGKEDNE